MFITSANNSYLVTKSHSLKWLAGYFRKFIKAYSQIDAPLVKLTGKDVFKWQEEAQQAFDNLKLALISPPVLKLLTLLKTSLECDASGIG